MRDIRSNSTFFLFCFAFIGYLSWLLIQPMANAVLFGAILAGSFYPLMGVFIKKFQIKKNIAAFVCLFIIIVGVIVPCLYIAIQLSSELVGAYSSIRDSLTEVVIQDFLFGSGKVAEKLREFSEVLSVDYSPESLINKLLSFFQGISGGAIQFVNDIFSNAMSFLLDFIIMLIVIYGFFAYGEDFKKYIFKLSPLPTEQEDRILKKFNQMNYVTLVCNGVAGLIQGVFGGIGLWAAGVQSIVFWTVVMILLAFIPIVGISFVYLPVALYFIIKGEVLKGVILIVYYLTVSILMEKIFKAKFIGSRVQMNSLVVFLSIVGGMKVFGIPGIFYGPLVIVIFMTMVEIYHDSYERLFNR